MIVDNKYFKTTELYFARLNKNWHCLLFLNNVKFRTAVIIKQMPYTGLIPDFTLHVRPDSRLPPRSMDYSGLLMKTKIRIRLLWETGFGS